MALPYVSIKERRSPSDVISYQHMQLLVDTANDADALLTTQHRKGESALAGQHLGAAPPVHIGVAIIVPPVPGTGDPLEVKMCAGYIDRDSLSWQAEIDKSTDIQHHYLTFRTPGDTYRVLGVEVGVSFSGTFATNADGAGHNNLLMLHPPIARNVGDGKDEWEVYFGPNYTAGDFLSKLKQVTILCQGFERSR